jgi:hypothetical protein
VTEIASVITRLKEAFGCWLFSRVNGNWKFSIVIQQPYVVVAWKGHWMAIEFFWLPKFVGPYNFFYIRGIGISIFLHFLFNILWLWFYFTINVINFEESGHSMHYFVLLWFQICLHIYFTLLFIIPRQIMSINQVEGEVMSRMIKTLILKTFTLGWSQYHDLGLWRGTYHIFPKLKSRRYHVDISQLPKDLL